MPLPFHTPIANSLPAFSRDPSKTTFDGLSVDRIKVIHQRP